MAAGLFVVAFFSNLNAIVDLFLHPEIAYLDPEHLVVGGVTGSSVAVLLVMLRVCARHSEQSSARVAMLEAILPICAHCKKIRVAALDAASDESWRPVEFYFRNYTATKLSHGICPDCIERHYPDYSEGISC